MGYDRVLILAWGISPPADSFRGVDARKQRGLPAKGFANIGNDLASPPGASGISTGSENSQ